MACTTRFRLATNLLALLSATIAGCALVPIPHTIGDIEFAGCVYDKATGTPISDASIMLSYPTSYSNTLYDYVGEVKSDASGCFRFSRAPQLSLQPMRGPVTVNVYASGYRTAFLSPAEVAGRTDVSIYLRDARQ